EHNRLFLLYGDGCKSRQLMLTSSDDEGRTWTRSTVVNGPQNSAEAVFFPSLIVMPGGTLGVLWRDRQSLGAWLFSEIHNERLADEAVVVSPRLEGLEFAGNSMWTAIFQPGSRHGASPNTISERAITLSVANMQDRVWRGHGLVALGEKVIAVWLSEHSDEVELYSGVLVPGVNTSRGQRNTDAKTSSDLDVTEQVRLLYGGTQRFDSATGTLTACVVLANRGSEPLQAPIRLEAINVASAA